MRRCVRHRPLAVARAARNGERPEALEWHLATAILTRAAHPFHRQVPAWRERMEAMVTTAEVTLD
jgi:hypothetical protein